MGEPLVIAISIIAPPLLGVALRKLWFYYGGGGISGEKDKKPKRPALKVFEPGVEEKNPYAEE